MAASKFGPNGEQLERFVEATASLRFDDMAQVIAEMRSPAVSEAHHRAVTWSLPAARRSAIDKAARDAVRSLRHMFPKPTTTAERAPLGTYTMLLRAAVFAVALRPELGDETVGLLVDPFAERVGFEWRSRGIRRDVG